VEKSRSVGQFPWAKVCENGRSKGETCKLNNLPDGQASLSIEIASSLSATHYGKEFHSKSRKDDLWLKQMSCGFKTLFDQSAGSRFSSGVL